MRFRVSAYLLAIVPIIASAQVTAPIYRDKSGQVQQAQGTMCLKSDGTECSASGGSSTPTGTAGAPNASVVSVQGVDGGTPQNVKGTGQNTAANSQSMVPASDSPAFPVTSTTLATAANQTNGLQRVQGVEANGTAATVSPIGVGGVTPSSTANLSAIGNGQRMDFLVDHYGNQRTAFATYVLTPNTGSVTTAGYSINAMRGADAPANAVPFAVLDGWWNGTNVFAAGGDATGMWAGGHGSIATGQVSVGTTATLIVPARVGRQKVGVTVTTAVQCAFGNAGVTLTTGWPLAAVAYASDSWDTAAALYGVCASTATIADREQF